MLRTATGGNPQTDMLYDKFFCQDIYSNQTRHTAEGLSSIDMDVINKLKVTFSNGGVLTVFIEYYAKENQ